MVLYRKMQMMPINLSIVVQSLLSGDRQPKLACELYPPNDFLQCSSDLLRDLDFSRQGPHAKKAPNPHPRYSSLLLRIVNHSISAIVCSDGRSGVYLTGRRPDNGSL